jgi:hypothetical protein
MRKCANISPYITLQLLHSEFPYIGGKLDFLFYQCSLSWLKKTRHCLFSVNQDDWRLSEEGPGHLDIRIRSASPADSGEYECRHRVHILL